VAVVTGSNKGVGYEIARQLARNGLTTVMTARDVSRGTKAVEALRSEIGSDRIAFHPLDVCSQESAVTLSTWLKQTYGGVDILVGFGHLPFEQLVAKLESGNIYYSRQMYLLATFLLRGM
jgi:NAD(P)-dependent dehydrogenase (short-subunit alcohol dehydrogenase family)